MTPPSRVPLLFFGSSEYSVVVLQRLLTLKSFPIKTVITKKDQPVGRQQKITPNPIATFTQKNHLLLLQPEEFNQDFTDQFRRLAPELVLVVAYGPPYFTQELIDLPKYKIINIHPSPLPRYRGATPGPWQIINGETDSAITFFQIDAKPDHGPIIAQIPFPISSSETAQSFYQKAFSLAADNLENVLLSYLHRPQNLRPQDPSQASYFPKFTKESALINWSWEPVRIECFVRALYPWPVAWTHVQNQKGQTLAMKIFSTSPNPAQNQLLPQKVQIEGKTPTSWSEIKNYYSLSVSSNI